MKLTIKRPECFSEAHSMVLEMFSGSNSIESLTKNLKTMWFITSCFEIKSDEKCARLIPTYGTDTNIAAEFEIE